MDFLKLFPGGFPLTVERLQFMQNSYSKAISQLTKLAGDGNIIISGVEVNEAVNPNTVSAGIVIIGGEIMEFRSGDINATVSIYEDVTLVPYNEDVDQDGNLDEKEADSVRYAKCGTDGEGGVAFSSFKRVSSLLKLLPKVGDIKMIFRAYDPQEDEGWVLCDGSNGTPNMVNRFPIGVGENALGATGGIKENNLNESQMPQHNHDATAFLPPHNHNYKSNIYVEEGNFGNTKGVDGVRQIFGSGENRNNTTDTNQNDLFAHYENINTDNNTGTNVSVTVQNKGNGAAVENRPPFLALNFLMYVGL